MLSDFIVGLKYLANGARSVLRADRTGALVTTDGHARYTESTLQGRRFVYAVGQAFTPPSPITGTAATCGLYNPANSGVNAIIDDIIVGFATSPSGSTAIYLVGNTGVTPPVSGLASASAHVTMLSRPGAGFIPAIVPFTTLTLPAAPFAMRLMASVPAASAINMPLTFDEIGGRIVLAPGSVISLAASGSCAASASFTWEEVVA